MPEYSIEKLLPYKQEDLYSLVSDIEEYPNFLPWVESARIINKEENKLLAELVLNFKGIGGKYSSNVFLNKKDFEIYVELAEGPFKHLYNGWKFIKDGKQTRVEFDIDFKLKVSILESLVGSMFDRACLKTMQAFEKRAAELF